MTDQDPAAQRQHIHYFDPLRLIAAFCVIYMHVASSLLRGEVNMQWELANLFTSFAFTAVPLFLMMSGYLLLSDEKTADISYLWKKRLPRLAVPLVFWNVLAVVEILLAQGRFTPSALWTGLVYSALSSPAVHLWYMYLLIALYVISPLLYACVRSLNAPGRRYLLVLIAAVTVQSMLLALLPKDLDVYVSMDLFGKLKIYSGNLCTFLLGWYLGRTKRTFPNWLLGGTAAVLLAVIAAGTHVLTAGAGTYTADFQDQSAGFEVALAVCLFLLWKQNFNRPLPRFLTPAVQLSMPVYMMHGLLLTVLEVYGFFPHTFAAALAESAAIFLVCFLCMKTAASVKPFCYLITGLRYDAACRSCNWQYTWANIRKKNGNAP